MENSIVNQFKKHRDKRELKEDSTDIDFEEVDSLPFNSLYEIIEKVASDRITIDKKHDIIYICGYSSISEDSEIERCLYYIIELNPDATFTVYNLNIPYQSARTDDELVENTKILINLAKEIDERPLSYFINGTKCRVELSDIVEFLECGWVFDDFRYYIREIVDIVSTIYSFAGKTLSKSDLRKMGERY